MFMNIAPPPDRIDPNTNVMTPQSIDYPAFLSSDLNVSVGKPSQVYSNNQPLMQFENLKQPPRERLEKMKKEYRNLSSWIDKANYLEEILNSDVETKHKKSTPISKKSENLTEKEPEDLILDAPIVEEKDEITPTQPSEDDESKKQQSLPKFDIPSLIVTEDDDIAPVADYLMEDYLSSEKDKYSYSQESKDTYLSETESYSSKNLISSSNAAYDSLNYPIFKDSSKTCGRKNTNKKGKQAEFSSSSEEDSLYLNKMNSTYSIQEFNTQDGFAPLLRNINSKISKRRNKCRTSSSYSDVVEHEDQDPSYSTKSESEQLKKDWAQETHVIPIEALDPESAQDSAVPAAQTSPLDKELAHEPVDATIKTLDNKGTLEETLPNVSLQGESPVMEDEIAGCPPQSKPSCLMSHIENLKQSMVLKSILSKDLQDLSEKLFSEPDISIGTASKKSSSIILTVQDDKSPCGLKDQIFEECQDLDSLISKGRPENISWVAKEQVPEQNSLGREVDFPVHKKRRFKTKHLESEICDFKSDLIGLASDFDIKNIVIAPVFSEMGEEANETQKQLPTDAECLSSKILLHYKESKDKMELPQAKSIISQIIQAFPIDILLECGMIKVVELDNEYHSKFLLDSGRDFAEERVKFSTKDDSESFPGQSMPIIPKETTSTRRVQFIDKSQNMPPQYSELSTPDNKTNLSSNSEIFYSKENYIRYLKGLNNSITSKHSESDIIMAFLKSIFNVYFKYSQSRRRQQPEKDLERLINYSSLNNTEDFREMEENFDKVDKLDQKPILSQKLCVFLEELSESEIKNLKSELSKHIQHYLVEELLDAGHITKEDLPKIYQNLYLMNEKKEPIGQNIFLEKYSGTIKEILSFINNFNHHCIGKQLEIKLRSFLNEILQNYFLRNFSESSLFKQIESENLHSNLSSLRAKKPSISSHDLRQGITRGGLYRKPEIKMKYPLSKSLQNYLKALSDNELLNIQTNLSKRIYCLWIERLSKLGLITETQVKRATPHIKLFHSNAAQLKSIKSDLCCKDKNESMKGHLENQDSIPEIVQNTKIPENRELIRKEEKESTCLNNVKENPSIIGEQKAHPMEEAETQGLESKSSNRNSLVIALHTNSSERLTDSELKKQKKEQGAPQFSRADTVGLKTEIQDPYNGSGKAKSVQSNVCCERMLKTKPLDKHNSFCRLLIQRNTEAVLVTCPRIATCKMASEDKDYGNKCPFNFNLRQNNISYFDPESGNKFKLSDQYQRWKGHNNNNKKRPVVIFGQYKKEIQTLYPKLLESSNEKYTTFLESHPFKYKTMKAEKGSKSFLFPEVFKSEHLKPKIRKERDHHGKQKKSLTKIGRGLPSMMPATRGLRKSIPKSMLQWTARRTIHDCSDRFEELPANAFQNSEKAKSRARLVGKSSEEHPKHPGRPYTAPEMIKRRDSYSGRHTHSRLSSTSSFQMSDLAQDYEAHKMQQRKFRREC